MSAQIVYVARDRAGQIRAVLPDDPARRSALSVEIAKWRRQGYRVSKESQPLKERVAS